MSSSISQQQGVSKTSRKWQNRLFIFFAFVLGLLLGSLYPEQALAALPILGTLTGLIMFFVLHVQANDESDAEQATEANPKSGYHRHAGLNLLVRMLLYFIIGSALSSSILLSLQRF